MRVLVRVFEGVHEKRRDAPELALALWSSSRIFFSAASNAAAESFPSLRIFSTRLSICAAWPAKNRKREKGCGV